MVEEVCFDWPVFTTDQAAAIQAMLTEGDMGKLKKLGIYRPEVEDEAADMLQAAAQGNDILEIRF